jgi:hypothetical protein
MASKADAFTLYSCVAYISTLMMEAKYSFETLIGFLRNTWRYIPEDRTLQLGLFNILV